MFWSVYCIFIDEPSAVEVWPSTHQQAATNIVDVYSNFVSLAPFFRPETSWTHSISNFVNQECGIVVGTTRLSICHRVLESLIVIFMMWLNCTRWLFYGVIWPSQVMEEVSPFSCSTQYELCLAIDIHLDPWRAGYGSRRLRWPSGFKQCVSMRLRTQCAWTSTFVLGIIDLESRVELHHVHTNASCRYLIEYE